MYSGGVLAANRLRAGGSPPASSSLAWTDHGEDPSNSSTYTFSSKSLGSASADRRIVVFVGARRGLSTTATCTVAGVSASQEANIDWSVSGTQLFMFVADVPTGTTGDIVVSPALAWDRCGIEVYALYGVASGTPDATSTRDTDGAFGSFTLAADSHVAGAVFAIPSTNRTARISGASDDLSAGSPTISFTAAETDISWTGLTEDHDAVVEVIGGTGFLGAPAIIAAWEAV